MIPKEIKILLSADRFYGTAALISLCQRLGWQYRIRLKSKLILYHQGSELKTGELLGLGLTAIESAELSNSGVKTHIGVLQEDGYKDSWIIAMNCRPNRGRVLDYGMRWGIEALFSDMKIRGFGITKTQLRECSRIERLILVLTIACFRAVSTGMEPRKTREQPSKKAARSLVSYLNEA